MCGWGGKPPPPFLCQKIRKGWTWCKEAKNLKPNDFCLFVYFCFVIFVGFGKLDPHSPSLVSHFPSCLPLFRSTAKACLPPPPLRPTYTPLHFRIHFTLVPCVPQVKQEHFQMFGGYNEVTMISFLIWLSISKEKGRETSCRSCRNIKHSSLYVNKYMYTVHIV